MIPRFKTGCMRIDAGLEANIDLIKVYIFHLQYLSTPVQKHLCCTECNTFYCLFQVFQVRKVQGAQIGKIFAMKVLKKVMYLVADQLPRTPFNI